LVFGIEENKISSEKLSAWRGWNPGDRGSKIKEIEHRG